MLPTSEIIQDFAHHGHYLQEQNTQLRQLVEYAVQSWIQVYLQSHGWREFVYPPSDAIMDTIHVDLADNGFIVSTMGDFQHIRHIAGVCNELYWRIHPVMERFTKTLNIGDIRLDDWLDKDLVILIVERNEDG